MNESIQKLKDKSETNIAAKCLYYCLKALKKVYVLIRNCARFAVKREYRALVLMKTFNRERTQQTTQLTFFNRYPKEFSAVKEYFELQGKSDIKILSFGCCTGEEILTLRRYFPDATLVGAEINRESLRICNSRKEDDKMIFIKSTPENIAAEGPFDAVFAMAVLERTPHKIENEGITDMSKIYPYEKFEKTTLELDSYLKTGGIMALSHAHYYILDTPLKDKYSVYSDCGFDGLIFDTNSQLKGPKGYVNDLFVKNM